MLIFNVNGKRTECPVSWEECKVRTYQRLKTEAKEGDHAVKIFSILTGTEFSKVWEAQAEDIEAGIYQATAFVFNQPETFREEPKPQYFRLGNETVLVPQKIGSLTVGQNFRMRQELAAAAKEGKPLESLLSIATAIYLQPLVDRAPFDMDRARELEKEILEMNIYDVFPIGFFLLNRLMPRFSVGTLFSLQNLTRFWNGLPKKLKLSYSLLLTISFSLSAMPGLSASCLAWSSRNPSTTLWLSSTPGSSATSTTNDLQMLKNG